MCFFFEYRDRGRRCELLLHTRYNILSGSIGNVCSVCAVLKIEYTFVMIWTEEEGGGRCQYKQIHGKSLIIINGPVSFIYSRFACQIDDIEKF